MIVQSTGKILFNNVIWHFNTPEKIIYLTFDDGPNPDITEWVLETLDQFKAKATFFCKGANAEKYPELFAKTQSAGHSIGNHTYSHKNGWKSSSREYYKDVLKANHILQSYLFRPPYGKIKPQQVKTLGKKFTIIMWDVLTKDYDSSISKEQCLNRSTRYVKNGSIVVFHDTQKASANLKYTLPQFLEKMSHQGYAFRSIPQ